MVGNILHIFLDDSLYLFCKKKVIKLSPPNIFKTYFEKMFSRSLPSLMFLRYGIRKQ